MPLAEKEKVARQRLELAHQQTELVKALTLDPWVQPYRYVYPGQHGAFDLFSVGPDGREGTADDVTNWATPSTAPSATTGQTAEQVMTEAANAAVAVIQRGTEELRRQTAIGQVYNLSSAVEMYKSVGGAYPTTQEGLQALLIQPPGAASWMGPYVDSTLHDPWGRAYRYVCPGRHGAFDLFSVGPDGAEGTDDDVTSRQ